MKKILMILAITMVAFGDANAQTKATKEKCSVSADKKTMTCCKTVPNPDYKASKTAQKATASGTGSVAKTSTTHVHQVCKDEGGYYTCCTHKKVTKTAKTEKTAIVKADK